MAAITQHSAAAARKLSELVQCIPGAVWKRRKDPVIKHVLCDSRKVKMDSLFVAVPGHKADGGYYAMEAAANGATAIVAETDIDGLGEHIAFVRVPNARIALSALANEWYGRPSQRMKVAGVTGTNGKTTTAFLMQAMMEQLFEDVGLIGTVKYELPGREVPANNTTPGPLELHSMMAEMLRGGVEAVSMEVSSHALHQHRADHVDFDVAIFTNLTRDHLDYHKTMEEYCAAKRRLFENLAEDAMAVLNADDAWYEVMASGVKGRHLSYAIDKKADITAAIRAMNRNGVDMELRTPKGTVRVQLPLLGKYNVYNALAAVGGGLHLGLDLPAIKEALETVTPVPGRLERVVGSQDFTVLVDYAHTDDALKNVLTCLRAVTTGRLICVFGCGGDRDKTKRPAMGAVACELADHVVITSDNPRTENPDTILADIVAGIKGGSNYLVEADRTKAIQAAVKLAKRDDVVLIAGKGHETYQILKDTVIPFDDREVARAALNKR